MRVEKRGLVKKLKGMTKGDKEKRKREGKEREREKKKRISFISSLKFEA